MKYVGVMFSGPKTTICSDHIIIVDFDCSYKDKRPTYDSIKKILCWRACENTTDIKAFLEMAVQCRNHIPNFMTIAVSFYKVVKKRVTFEWRLVQKKAQADLKAFIE